MTYMDCGSFGVTQMSSSKQTRYHLTCSIEGNTVEKCARKRVRVK